jgi:cyclopropane fatty-acyl-phospholipid synthase-like methyltransferase
LHQQVSHYVFLPCWFSSSAYFPNTSSSLDEAEEAMMALYSERSQLQDGQEVLDLGCGWGSLSIYIAEHYPNSKITSVSNSETQRAFITEECGSVILWLASISVLPL